MHFAFKFFSHTCFYHRFFASRSSPFPTRWLRANTFPTLRLTATPLLPFPLVLLPLFNLWTSTISTSYNYAALWIKSLVLVTNHFLLQSLTFLYIRRSVNAYAFTHFGLRFCRLGLCGGILMILPHLSSRPRAKRSHGTRTFQKYILFGYVFEKCLCLNHGWMLART